LGIITDYALGRQLNHSHDATNNALYILKAGDTATGTINFPITISQGNALIASINAGNTTINAQRVASWHRHFMVMGS
jgi:hypothetical protein